MRVLPITLAFFILLVLSSAVTEAGTSFTPITIPHTNLLPDSKIYFFKVAKENIEKYLSHLTHRQNSTAADVAGERLVEANQELNEFNITTAKVSIDSYDHTLATINSRTLTDKTELISNLEKDAEYLARISNNYREFPTRTYTLNPLLDTLKLRQQIKNPNPYYIEVSAPVLATSYDLIDATPVGDAKPVGVFDTRSLEDLDNAKIASLNVTDRSGKDLIDQRDKLLETYSLIVLISQKESDSQQLAQDLNLGEGKVLVLEGGMDAWINAKLEFVKPVGKFQPLPKK